MEKKINSSPDTLSLKIQVVQDGNCLVGKITEHEEFGPIIAQAKTEEKLEKKLKSLLIMYIQHLRESEREGMKLSILRYYKSDNQFWFRIVGVGLTINWTDSKYIKIKHGWKWFGITTANGLRIGKLLIFFNNLWRKLKSHNLKNINYE